MWKGLSLKVYKMHGDFCHDWFQEILYSLPIIQLASFAYGIWCLWWEFNRVRHGEYLRPLHTLVDLIKNQQTSYMGIGTSRTATDGQQKMSKWEAPNGGLVKLNVDSAVPKDDGLCTGGFVVREAKFLCQAPLIWEIVYLFFRLN